VGMWSHRNLRCAAGATYQTRDYPNSAYYATFDTDHITVFPIRYEDQPRETWTVDPSIFTHASRLEFTFSVPCPPGQVGFRILGPDKVVAPRDEPRTRLKVQKKITAAIHAANANAENKRLRRKEEAILEIAAAAEEDAIAKERPTRRRKTKGTKPAKK